MENEIFGKSDFFLTDNYVLRLKPLAIKKLIEELRLSLNSHVQYKNRSYAWDTLLGLKTQELARCISGRSDELDFADPHPAFREDSKEFRHNILMLTVSEARKLGISKSTLWDLQKRAPYHGSLNVYEKVKQKLCRK